jgi:NAD(P)-dependent dehydrogenase (short-subunit alcohol dehydrogenase family)
MTSSRVAVVTGSGSGLGAAIARALAADGADLLLHYRSHAEGVDAVAFACRELGREVVVAQGDFSADPGTAARIVDVAVERLGRIDVLVNNAALVDRLAPFEQMPRSMFEETLAVNVVAPFLATQAAAGHMVSQGDGGRIINIGSVHGRQSAPEHTAYETSKGAIDALTFSTAVALGAHGITVNCVAPGAVVVERYADVDWDEAWYVSRTPVGRMGRPGDISSLVRFLASEEAGFITGETIYVDGGMTRRMPLVR